MILLLNQPPTLRLYARSLSLFFLCLLSLIPTAYATVTTHEIESSYKGYSIEKIPGTDEFVAAGTFYIDDLDQRFTGYHFMHLDANGYVIGNTIYKYPVPGNGWEYRVVDIAVEDNDNFWIVMSARYTDPSSNITDIIYAEKVSILAMGLGSAPNTLTIGNLNDPQYRNLYPTHSLYNDGYLFICGYASAQTPSKDMPTSSSKYKKGLISRTDIYAPGGPATGLMFWDTYPNNTPLVYDYDMALKMRISSLNADHLLITGAANTGTSPISSSGVVAIRLSMSTLNTVVPPTVMYFVPGMTYPSPPPAQGMYGMDIYEKEGDPFGSVYILSNQFQYDAVQAWGILRTENNLIPHPTFDNYMTPPTLLYHDWAKQFLPDPSPSSLPETDLVVVGERTSDIPDCQRPANLQAPSTSNVNPFLAAYELWWDDGTGGGTPGINWTNPTGQIIHASDNGTKSALPGTYNLDYFTPTSTVAGTGLENVQRLYTFACRFEDLSANDEIALITPMLSPGNGHLNTKFIRTTNTGDETTCSNQWSCSPRYFTGHSLYQQFTLQAPVQESSFPTGATIQRVISSIDDDCSSGSFKPAGIAKTPVSDEISIFPNPATNNINVNLGTAKGIYTFTLTDLAGKAIFSSSGNTNSNTVSIQLPALSKGIYIATVATEQQTHTEKLTIE